MILAIFDKCIIKHSNNVIEQKSFAINAKIRSSLKFLLTR